MSSHATEDLVLPINSEEDLDFVLISVKVTRELHDVSSLCMFQALRQMCSMTDPMDQLESHKPSRLFLSSHRKLWSSWKASSRCQCICIPLGTRCSGCWDLGLPWYRPQWGLSWTSFQTWKLRLCKTAISGWGRLQDTYKGGLTNRACDVSGRFDISREYGCRWRPCCNCESGEDSCSQEGVAEINHDQNIQNQVYLNQIQNVQCVVMSMWRECFTPMRTCPWERFLVYLYWWYRPTTADAHIIISWRRKLS